MKPVGQLHRELDLPDLRPEPPDETDEELKDEPDDFEEDPYEWAERHLHFCGHLLENE